MRDEITPVFTVEPFFSLIQSERGDTRVKRPVNPTVFAWSRFTRGRLALPALNTDGSAMVGTCIGKRSAGISACCVGNICWVFPFSPPGALCGDKLLVRLLRYVRRLRERTEFKRLGR